MKKDKRIPFHVSVAQYRAARAVAWRASVAVAHEINTGRRTIWGRVLRTARARPRLEQPERWTSAYGPWFWVEIRNDRKPRRRIETHAVYRWRTQMSPGEAESWALSESA